MRRKLFTLLSAMSLLMLLVLGAAIGRSHWVLDQWNQFRGTEFRSVEFEQGHLYVVHGRGDIDEGVYDAYRPRPAGRDLPPPWSLYESGVSEMTQQVGGRSGPLTVHHQRLSLWWVAALTAVLPAIWATRRLPWRRWFGQRPPGHCAACGYDLRATPDRCPECGAASKQAA